jgi:Mg2+ and Co2+ transporter CorA
VTDTKTKVDVVTDGDATTTDIYGDAWWTNYRQRTSGWGNKREVSTVIKDVTVDAARAELSKLDHEVNNIETAVKEMNSYVNFLEKEIATQEKRIVTIETLTKEKARWEQRLVELNKIIDTKP